MRWLEDNRVAHDDRRHGHSGHDGAGKIPRRNDSTNTERNIEQAVALAGELRGCFDAGHTQGFAGVEFAEVDGFGNIGIGFAPVLADFEYQPGAEFETALADDVGDAKYKAGTFFGSAAAPSRKRGEGGLHGGLDFGGARILMETD